MTLTIDGMAGALEPRDSEEAATLATELIRVGYSVRVEGVPVALEYRPGYDLAVYDTGFSSSTPVHAEACS